MSVDYLFRCDTCGATGPGEPTEDYVYPYPPRGWVWNWGPGLGGPHACSDVCWQPLARTADGRIRLTISHQKNEFRDLVRRSNDLATIPASAAPRPIMTRRPMLTVYFIQRGDDGPVKIGITKNLKSRLNGLQTSSAEKLFVRREFNGTQDDEAMFHQVFAAHRMSGEWFFPTVLRFIPARTKTLGPSFWGRLNLTKGAA